MSQVSQEKHMVTCKHDFLNLGSSGSGKTELIVRILRETRMTIDKQVHEILYIKGPLTEDREQMELLRQSCKENGILFTVRKNEFDFKQLLTNDIWKRDNSKVRVLVLDDCYEELIRHYAEAVLYLCTAIVRHQQLLVRSTLPRRKMKKTVHII